MSKFRVFVYEKGPLKGMREKSIYQDADGNKYLRILEGKTDSFKPLGTKLITEAVKLRDARIKAKVASNLGLAEDPAKVAASAKVTVKVVILPYQSDKYPDIRGNARKPGDTLNGQIARCEILLKYFNGNAKASDICQDDLDNYHIWRVENVKKGPVLKNGKRGKPRGEGDRATDMDLNTLNNAYRWAKRKKLLKTNPLAERSRYRAPSDVQHCREFAVESTEELHEVAGLLMSKRTSEVLGWQLLIEGASGLRTKEAVSLRLDAGATEPGGLTPDGKNLCVRRAKKSKRQNPYVRVNDGLDQILAAHKIWHAQRYPLSPHYFPGRDRKAGKAINKSILTKALKRLHRVYLDFRKKEKDPKKFPEKPYLTKKYTSHGAGRAFYIFARRCQGASDPEIAYEINHTGGVATLESVYALPARHWRTGEALGMNWVPKGLPAWTKIKKVDFSGLGTGMPNDFSI